LKIKAAVADPAALDRNLKTVVNTLLSKEELPAKFVTNKILSDGQGWHECFVYKDKKHTVIMQYKIDHDCLMLAKIGSPDTLTEKRKIFLK
jgi:mRNA-degrading endonuclease YafQ of YafQ-DinJ toxin-antitoxin module